MKAKMMFGALMLSAALCSQGFSGELLARLNGLKGGCDTCGPVQACETCAPVKACAPEPACEKAIGCNPCATPVRDLFCGLKDLFACKSCCTSGCDTCAPVKACAPEPVACEKACGGERGCGCERPVLARVRKVLDKAKCATACAAPACCEKACAAPVACEKSCDVGCDVGCEPKCRRRPLAELVNKLFACKRSCKPACGDCGVAEASCGCNGGAPVAAPAAAPAAPAKNPVEAAPLPKAPQADAPKDAPKAEIQTNSDPSA